MNQAMVGDVRFFLASVLLGIAAGFCYDLLRVWRRFQKQSLFLVSLQDFIYWFLLGFAGFRLIYGYNAGTLRLFVFLGIGLGALLYMVTLGRVVVKCGLMLLRLVTLPLQKGLLFLKKQGKLISRIWLRRKKRNHQGRKDALASKKRKEKNRP